MKIFKPSLSCDQPKSVEWSQFISQSALPFISYYRRNDRFGSSQADDCFILFKYNIFSLFLISKCFYYKPINDCCSHDDTEVAKEHRRFFIVYGDTNGNGIRESFVNVCFYFLM